MVPLGCPLCCRQDFVSVGALHDHLLYYTYRPLQCAVCSAHVGGIQDFTRHLEMHMGDGMPTSLHAHAVKPSVPVLEDSRSEVQIEVQGRTQGRVGSRDGSSSYLCSQLINNDQTNITRSYPTNEESIELILRAYFCQTCGAKVVGKDAYFLHIREHSIVPSNNNSLTLSATVGSCPEVSSPALSSHLASDASTPGNFMTDTETLPVNESEEPSECLSDFIEENDMANQLKIREWQLEKLGKNIKRHKFLFGRSTGLSEQSPMGGKLRNDYSPVTPSSVEIAPISESSCSPYASMQSDNTYLYSVERHDSCPPSSSVCADQGLAERSDTYNSFPLVNRESLTTDPCSVGRPDSSVPSIVTDDGSINMYPCSVETPLSCNTLTSTDKGLLTTYSYTEGEPDLLCSQMKSGNGSFNDGGQVLSWLGPNTVINDETKSSSHLVTGPSSIMKSDTEEVGKHLSVTL
ncbi:uncharacterized protein LOC121862933 isoform X1 [Homarus americanus]|uniref:C2H2-type domain-containing protein n=1 Tax=Homarus americanus TaxID=6706 RepID=A0A8J5N1T5_HOMAM|nr:uncharacterized protein LOC121862933 isoform X1 [Homarus americanus]KAG7171634.1 hypothetical protein Hamer_G014773 [Homarus americanus]